MDIGEIRRLVKLVESSQIDELEIHDQNFQIRVSKSRSGVTASAGYPVYTLPYPPPGPQPFPGAASGAPVHEAKVEPLPGAHSENIVEICSPMVGTFYRAPAPDASPYIQAGDDIQPGKILCIIEAMKLMNEIEAEISGKLIKILVENAHPVEFNQPLFLVEKS
ncbi:MAG TPA: acetyl-CoA carboxylase biotin carboxyl carrier protein [bacterium]|nr:acetyl-CoA carboxylase biotin carboxyl carrier protein [bacterium]